MDIQRLLSSNIIRGGLVLQRSRVGIKIQVLYYILLYCNLLHLSIASASLRMSHSEALPTAVLTLCRSQHAEVPIPSGMA